MLCGCQGGRVDADARLGVKTVPNTALVQALEGGSDAVASRRVGDVGDYAASCDVGGAKGTGRLVTAYKADEGSSREGILHGEYGCYKGREIWR